ncbi:hypothetical protein GQR58_026279 [Nymphon striatum]|nr:hypothetical protein GQR58_026279 [Nymphon striatum]
MFGSNESHYQKWDIENSDNISLPSWTSCAAKFLNAGSEGQDWSALAVKLGYKEKKIGEFQDSMSPAQALIADWIHSSGNTKLSTDMMLSCLEEMHCTEIIEIMKESIVEKDPPPVFLSYQWDIQEDALLIRNQLEAHGFSCWMDVGQMGGGDLLYQQIYEGINSCKGPNKQVNAKKPSIAICSRSSPNLTGINGSTHDKVKRAEETFVLKLYGASSFELLDKYRHIAYKRAIGRCSPSSSFQLASLPPTSAAAKKHSYRNYHTVQEWMGNTLPPIEWGWRLHDGTLAPVETDRPVAPESLLHMVSCS